MSAATVPVQQATIRQYAKRLQLVTMAGQFATVAEQAIKEKQSHLSYLEVLLGMEVEERERNTVARRIKDAHFPKVKTLEDFAFSDVPHIPAAVVRNLAAGGYLQRSEPIIFLGETGTGKTHLATGLAVEACRQRKRVRFTTDMLIIGCDYHPAFQQIAFVDTATGDCGERRLEHREEAEKFYRELAAQGVKVRVGMEASGHARWFKRLLAELNSSCGWETQP